MEILYIRHILITVLAMRM